MKSLKKRVFNGLLWSSLDTLLLKGLNFVVMIFIARIIGPEEFGFVGMISIFLGIGVTLFDGGMAASLIRSKNLDNYDYSTVYFSNILISLAVYVVVFITSPFVADFYGYEMLSDLIRVYSLIFLVMSFSAVHAAIYNKKMLFKEIAKINLPATIISIFVGLYLSLNDYGVWSVVIMLLVSELIKTILYNVFSTWKPQLIFSIIKFKNHFYFGYKLMLSGLLNVLFKNVYNVIIGKYYSPQTLGFYERSKQFNHYPSSTLSGIMERVSYPMMSEIKDDKAHFKIIYKKTLTTALLLISSIVLITSAISEPLFLIILGEDWLPAVPLFKILSFGTILYPIHSFSLNVLKTYGRSDLFLKTEILKKVIVTVSILALISFGLLGLVWSSVLSSILASFVNIYYSGKIINYSIREHLIDVIPIIINSLILYFIVDFCSTHLFTNNNFLKIILSSCIGICFYILLNLLIKGSPIHYLVFIIKNKIKLS